MVLEILKVGEFNLIFSLIYNYSLQNSLFYYSDNFLGEFI